MLDQADRTDKSSLSRNSAFNIEIEARNGSNEIYD